MLSVIANGFYLDSPLIFFPVHAMVIFLVTFTFITVRTLRSSRNSIQRMAGLPLCDDSTIANHEKAQGHE